MTSWHHAAHRHRHIDQFDEVFRELLPLTRTTVDGQVQFDPSAHDHHQHHRPRSDPRRNPRPRNPLRALPHGKIPMMLVFSTLLTIGVRNCEGDAFTGALADMYELALDPKLARKMLSESSIPRRLEEQGYWRWLSSLCADDGAPITQY
ncbi:hypothetical protein [Rhodococcus sp. NJ-530]|uniref:hypothetical protein n=1 Tax=Rhodococcus sp. NJ-530 TaxID=2490853 RepID=UPI000F61B86F|nr:hypothetical protein [Rhodococcus sp. NJ-530]AZI65442.1 hypothetical protein EHW12_30430 [Rhodococcus sp. NJ-530]